MAAKGENAPPSGGYIKGLKKDRTETLEEMVTQTVGGQTSYRCVIATGVPFKRLIEIAEDEAPRLIAIGTNVFRL